MNMVDIILKKRAGEVLSEAEIRFFIQGYTEGSIPDYQMSALLMAIFLRGMNKEETGQLTMAMTDSGDRIDLSEIPGIKVDKHSTGGVGDKTTLIVGPIVAACGVPVAKMSGRGLGHTGGTIDKLESIPGVSTALPKNKFISQVQEIGIAIAGQTANLAPADKKIYALRDVTGTIDNMSLIASSIMSKKIAAGADKILLDVKYGSGAFMKDKDQAVELGKTMVDIATAVGLEAVVLVTNMDKPLGLKIGNCLEVEEVIEVLRGGGPEDLKEESLELAANMLYLAGKGTLAECTSMADEAISSGRALAVLAQMVAAQGGPQDFAAPEYTLGRAPYRKEVRAERDGYVSHIVTDHVGMASGQLGAGRMTKEDIIDPLAGIVLEKITGDVVRRGDVLATLYTSDESRLEQAERIFLEAYEIGNQKPEELPLVYARVTQAGVEYL